MKTDNKLLNTHLTLLSERDRKFVEEVERLKKDGKRLSNQEKAMLLNKARRVIYSGK